MASLHSDGGAFYAVKHSQRKYLTPPQVMAVALPQCRHVTMASLAPVPVDDLGAPLTGSLLRECTQTALAYYNAEGNDTLYTFQFQPQPVNFEVIDRRIFAEVLYPKDIYDLIDHHIRECVKREVRMRVCKNCLRYFAVTGKASTEYCDRVCDSKGRTCREIGAINTWTQRKQGDEVFKEYRREYKKRFARINAGKLTKSVFYAWSEEARKKKEDCDNGTITPEDFSRWLKES